MHKKVGVHILVAQAFIGPVPKGKEVLHGDGVSSNNSASNLRYGTRKENVDDTRRHGTLPLGEKCHNAKLTEDDVRYVRKMHGVLSLSELSKALGGYNPSGISKIQRRIKWAHVQ